MTFSKLVLPPKHLASRVLHAYADWRIGATELEKRCYKTTDSIFLTFDDYGSASQVDELLAILRQHEIKAGFFPQGDWAQQSPTLLAKIVRSGHVVGNHTATHVVLLGMDKRSIEKEILGGVTSQWLRPPQGRYDDHIRQIAAGLGYAICYWTIDSRDWTGASVEEMRHTILTELHPGAVILFHMHGEHTAELLPSLITDIKRHGYTFTDHGESWEPSLKVN